MSAESVEGVGSSQAKDGFGVFPSPLAVSLGTLRTRLEGPFPDRARAAAELHQMCEDAGVSLNSAVRALGLKQSTVQCDAHLWQQFGETYLEITTVFSCVRRSHLRILSRIENPVQALACLQRAVAAAGQQKQRLTTTRLRQVVELSLSGGMCVGRQPEPRSKPTRRAVRIAAQNAYGKAAAWSARHNATDLLGKAVRELSAHEDAKVTVHDSTAVVSPDGEPAVAEHDSVSKTHPSASENL